MRSFRSLSVSALALAALVLFCSNPVFGQRYRLGGTPATTPAASADPAKPAAKPAPAPAATAKIVELETALKAATDKVAELEAQIASTPTAEDMTKLTTDLTVATNKVAELEKQLATANTSLATANANMAKAKDNLVASERTADELFSGRRLCFRLFVIGFGLFLLALAHSRLTERRRQFGFVLVIALVIGLVAFPQVAGAAPVPTVRCAPNFFAADGATSDVSCTGVRSATAITFSDTAVTAADVKVEGGKLKFKLTVGTGATTPAEPDMSIDGMVVGHPIGVVDAPSAGMIDFIIRTVQGNVGGNAANDTHARLVLEGLACPTADAVCLKDFRARAWGSKKGSSAQAGTDLRTSIVTDPRHQTAIKAALEAYAASMPAPAAGYDDSGLKTLISDTNKAVETLRKNGVAMADDLVKVKATADKAAAEAKTLRDVLAKHGSRGARKALEPKK